MFKSQTIELLLVSIYFKRSCKVLESTSEITFVIALMNILLFYIESVIGGWVNTKSSINLCKECTPVAFVDTPGIVTDTEYRDFLVAFVNNSLEVSILGNEPFMS